MKKFFMLIALISFTTAVLPMEREDNRTDKQILEGINKNRKAIERVEKIQRYICLGGTLACGLGLFCLLENRQAMERAIEELSRKLAESKDQFFELGEGIVGIVGGKISDTIGYCFLNGTEAVMEALKKNN